MQGQWAGARGLVGWSVAADTDGRRGGGGLQTGDLMTWGVAALTWVGWRVGELDPDGGRAAEPSWVKRSKAEALEQCCGAA